MATALLKIDGLAELKKALLDLPDDLKAEASVIMQAQAEEAARQIRAQYGQHRVSGNLQDHVVVEASDNKGSATMRVRATARHAWLFDFGSKSRVRANGGKTGRMPSSHVFIGIAIARRKIINAALIDLVTRAGLVVTGS